MRHRKTIYKLGRTSAHRKATLANLAAALFQRKHITTTEVKAKATQRFAERLITLGKKGTLHARRVALIRLRNKKIVHILFDEIAPTFEDRNGGYTRIIKLGQRHGDAARMAILELVGFETAKKKKKDKEATKEDAKKKSKKTEASKAKETASKKPEEKKGKGKKDSGKETPQQKSGTKDNKVAKSKKEAKAKKSDKK